MLSLTIIIPTKNRYDALSEALKSIARQTVKPQEIIIVDQTPNNDGAREAAAKLLPDGVRLNYIWDPKISGLTTARNVAIENVAGDLFLFLDDDVTLYPDFIERLIAAYKEHPEATGISGIPDNYTPPGKFFYYWTRVFTRGPFWNDRFPVYWNAARLSEPVRVSQMSGGMMSFKKSLVSNTRFDPNLRGVSDGEDVDFCVRLKGIYFIDPRCKLTHHFNASGREKDHWTRRHARAYTYLFFRNWRSHKLVYSWLWVGWLIAAGLGCASRRSVAPFHSLFTGHREGKSAGLGIGTKP